MHRGLFGLMSTAALIASVVAGCSSGGGTAADFDLPELPGTTPTVRTMEFTLEKYGLADNAVVLVSTTGKDETYDKAKDVTLTASYAFPAPEEENAEKGTAGKDAALADDGGDGGDGGDDGDDGDDDDDENTGDLRYNYRCAFLDSVNALNRLVADDISHKDIHPVSLARFDGQDAGYVSRVYPPCVVSKTGQPIYVKKVIDDTQTVHCNILYQCDKEGNTDIEEHLGQYAIDLAKAFDSDVSGTGKGIYQALTEEFGSEWRYTPAGGRDGDKRINIVLCDNDSMGGHLGAVRLCDAFKSSQVATSNAGEYIFLDVTKMGNVDVDGVTGKLGIGINKPVYNPETEEIEYYTYGGPSVEMVAALAHQLTHLIEVNSKVVREGQFDDFVLGETKAADAVERFGISEGLGELAANISGIGYTSTALNDINVFMGGTDWQVGVPNSVFLYDVQYANGGSIFCNDRGSKSNCVYGGSHLFMLWLLQNFGQDKISQIIKSQDTGMANVAAIMGEEAKDLFHDFNRMVYLWQFDNAPEDARIDDFPVPIVRGGATIGESIPGIDVLYDHRLRVEETIPVEPWCAKIVGFRPGEESEKDLTVKVRFPANGCVSVFRLTNNELAEDVEGVEVRDYEDRHR